MSRYVICTMPELAEVEWFRKQWNAGLGDEIVDVSLHARKYVFRGTSTACASRESRRPETAKIDEARKTDALPVFGRQLARHSSRHDRQDTESNRQIFGRANMTISFSINANARSSSPIRANLAVFVFITDRMNQLGGKDVAPEITIARIQSEIRRSILRSTSKRADQSRPCSCRTVFPGSETGWPTKFFGVQSFAIEANWKINRPPARHDFSRHEICCAQIARNSRERFLRSTAELADSSKMEARRSLPESPHASAPRNNRRPHHRVVPALPKVIGRVAHTRPKCNCRHHVTTCTTILWKPVTPEYRPRSSSNSWTSPSPSVARTTSV